MSAVVSKATRRRSGVLEVLRGSPIIGPLAALLLANGNTTSPLRRSSTISLPTCRPAHMLPATDNTRQPLDFAQVPCTDSLPPD